MTHAEGAAHYARLAGQVMQGVDPTKGAYNVALGARGSVASAFASLALYHQREAEKETR